MANRVVSVALKAEIGAYVAGMAKAAASTTALGAASDDMAKKTKGSFDVVGKMGQYAGLAVGAALVGIVTQSTKFESAMSGVAAATGLAGDALDGLRETAMRAGAETQYSATEAADAITEMSKAGVSAADIMGGGLDGALALAAAGQLGVADAAGIAATAMTQFRLSGEDLPHVADLLAAGAGKAMGSVDDLGQALNQAGLVASAAGLSIEETTGGLAAFASAGLIGSDAGTSFKTMLQAIQGPSGVAAEKMAELGINMYDSQGNMLGLSNMAGVLQQRLGGLTEEQRNSALTTIFGSDAVRAANVLYREGAAGIENWTQQVNDQGYAAEVAAVQNDNLAGDLEKLGGAFETLMIALGTSSQDPLRELTQMLTSIVNVAANVIGFFTDLPGPVQATLGTVAGLVVLNGPLSGVLDTLKGFGGLGGTMSAFSEALGYAKANGDGLFTVLGSVGEVAGGKLMGGLTKVVGYMGGPWGAAIAGGVLGLGTMAGILSSVGDATVDTAGATDRMTDAYKASAGAIDDNVRAMAAQEAADQNLRYGNLLEYADKAGVSLPLVTEAILGNEDALRQVTDAFGAYAEAEAQAATARGEDAGGIAQLSIDAAEASDAVNQLAGASGAGRSEAALLAEASGAVGEAMDGSAGAIAGAAEETQSYSDIMGEANKELDDLIAALAYLRGESVSLTQATNDVNAAVLDASEAFDDNGGAVLDASGQLNGYTRNGIEAYDRLVAMADANDTLIATMEQQGYTSEEVTAKDAELRDSFINTAIQMGLSSDKANYYADQIYGIPEDRTTQINANTETAAGRIAGIASALFGLPDGDVDVNADTSPADGAIRAFVARVTGTRVTLTGDFVGGAGVTVRRAQGGPVWGAGTATSDSIPAMLSNGEYVVKASSVSKYGIAALDAVNAGRLDDIAHFADGGLARSYAVPVGISGLDNISVSLAAMADAATAAGPAGSGSIGGTWTSIWNVVKAAIPAARQNSTFRRGDPGYHGRNKAVDFGYGSGPGGAGSAGLASINRFLYDNYGSKLAELIYDGIGDDRPDIKNGRPHTYNAATRAQHANHVHAANYANGGLVGMPQYKQGTPFVPNDGPAFLHRGEAVIPQHLAQGGLATSFKLGEIEDDNWAALLARGWVGRAGDKEERIYRPAGDMGIVAEDGSYVSADFYKDTTKAIEKGVEKGAEELKAEFEAGVKIQTDALEAAFARIGLQLSDVLTNSVGSFAGGSLAARVAKISDPLMAASALAAPHTANDSLPYGWNVGDKDQYGGVVPEGYTRDSYGTLRPTDWYAAGFTSREMSGASMSGGSGGSSSSRSLEVNVTGLDNAAVIARQVVNKITDAEYLHA